jgi:hypothetical protein
MNGEATKCCLPYHVVINWSEPIGKIDDVNTVALAYVDLIGA